MVDLVSAYNQIPLGEALKKYTSFVTGNKQWKFNYLPFKLVSGSMILTRLIDKILQDFRFSYFDGLVIFSEDIESQKSHLDIVLKRLQEAGLTVSLEKMVVALSF